MKLGPKVASFPEELHDYGLDAELLEKVYNEVKVQKKRTISWKLKGIPEIGFYESLHRFLKRWPKTCSAPIVELGKLYIAIDKNLEKKQMRPDNAYRFVEKLVGSSLPRSTVVSYNLEKDTIKDLQSELQQCSDEIQKLTADFAAMKLQLEDTKKELYSTKSALGDVINEAKCHKKQMLQRKTCEVEEFIADSLSLEEELTVIKEKNIELSKALVSVQKELSAVTTDAISITVDTDSNFIIETKTGGTQYSPSIRSLYYTLLADQVPPAKISNIIKSVLKCFFPSLSIEELALPKERCAGYMRTEELSVISTAHKAMVVHDSLENDKPLHLNMDGTTLNQKKLGGVAFNNMVLSCNVLPDGAAETAIEDVSKELEKLRKMATALKLTHADSINWTIFSSITSDSASAQKRCAKLMRNCQDLDRKRFGQAGPEALDIVENFCAMHLGCNLRKAFLSENNVSPSGTREYHSVDVFVHEFCKLFGCYGVPEYAYGATKFIDFLNIMSVDPSLGTKVTSYYKSCTDVVLDRQIGSRYFVTAANAGKILYLKEAAVEFLKYIGRESGNKLEKDVGMKLQDCNELAALKADALMFFHVYADLVILAKSTELKKSALEMNTHYFELQVYLEELKEHPKIIMNQNYRVFKSEGRLYGDDKKVNHRHHIKSKCVHDHLFVSTEWDETLLYPIISNGAAAMKSKLSSYAQNYLPGGIYWDPDPKIKEILAKLNPSNDLCESILGLNDYLNTAIPNMHQVTRSNLVQLKKNKTVQWLQQLPQSQQSDVIDLAVSSRREACASRKDDDAKVIKQRRDNMIQAHSRLQALRRKEQTEKDKLLKEHLITSSEELYQSIVTIDEEVSTATKRRAKKLALLKIQIKIRKKILKQNIRIVFTHSGKHRPIDDVIQELASFIDSSSHSLNTIDPLTLVGKRVNHKFELEDTHLEKWYSGTVVDYDPVSKLHTIKYDGEEDHCQFDITVDYILGDLVVTDN